MVATLIGMTPGTKTHVPSSILVHGRTGRGNRLMARGLSLCMRLPDTRDHSLALIDIAGDTFMSLGSFNTQSRLGCRSAAFSDDGQHVYLASNSGPSIGPTIVDVGFVGTFQIERETPELSPEDGHYLSGVVRLGQHIVRRRRDGNDALYCGRGDLCQDRRSCSPR